MSVEDTRGPPGPLLRLPNELLLLIAESLDNQKDVSALFRTNRRLAMLIDRVMDIFAIQRKNPTPPILWITRARYRRFSQFENSVPPLLWAIKGRYLGLARRLLRIVADINSFEPCRDRYGSPTPLHAAVQYVNTEVAPLLLENGARLDIHDEFGNTPLHVAVEKAAKAQYDWCNSFPDGPEVCPEAVEVESMIHLMFKHGADPKVQNNYRGSDQSGMTLLHKAAKYAANGAAMVGILLKYGVPVDYRTVYKKFTALHITANAGGVAATALLLEHGADVSATDNYGNTPLHFASTFGHSEVVKLLLSYGADPTVENDNGQKPLNRAVAMTTVK